MIEAAERDGVPVRQARCWWSPRRGIWVALSMIAANKGYGFLCHQFACNLSTKRLMQAFGSQVHVITEPDPVDGLLGRGSTMCGRCALRTTASLAEPVLQSAELDGAITVQQSTSPPVPSMCCSSARDLRDLDGLHTLLPGVAPAGPVVAVETVGSVTFGARRDAG